MKKKRTLRKRTLRKTTLRKTNVKKHIRTQYKRFRKWSNSTHKISRGGGWFYSSPNTTTQPPSGRFFAKAAAEEAAAEAAEEARAEARAAARAAGREKARAVTDNERAVMKAIVSFIEDTQMGSNTNGYETNEIYSEMTNQLLSEDLDEDQIVVRRYIINQIAQTIFDIYKKNSINGIDEPPKRTPRLDDIIDYLETKIINIIVNIKQREQAALVVYLKLDLINLSNDLKTTFPSYNYK